VDSPSLSRPSFAGLSIGLTLAGLSRSRSVSYIQSWSNKRCGVRLPLSDVVQCRWCSPILMVSFQLRLGSLALILMVSSQLQFLIGWSGIRTHCVCEITEKAIYQNRRLLHLLCFEFFPSYCSYLSALDCYSFIWKKRKLLLFDCNCYNKRLDLGNKTLEIPSLVVAFLMCELQNLVYFMRFFCVELEMVKDSYSVFVFGKFFLSN